MSLLTRIFGRSHDVETRGTVSFPGNGGINFLNTAGPGDAGINVTEMTAMAASAIYSCVSVIASTIATLPIHVVDRETGERVRDHPVHQLLAIAPNEYQTSPAFRESFMVNLLLWGNGYAYIERDALGRPSALLPLRSDRTRPARTPSGQLIYQTTGLSNSHDLPAADVLHVANLTVDGITGLSPIQVAKQSVGLTLALDRFAAKFFGNGGHVGGVLTVPSLKTDGMKEFARAFRDGYTGPENSWKVAILEDAMKWQPVEVNPEKSQAIEQRVHQVREACRIYRVPPSKVMDWERSSYANAEQAAIAFVQDTLLPWIVKIEAACNRVLLLESEKGRLEIKLNVDGLLRGDFKTRMDGYAIAIGNGVMTRAEARAKEGLPFIAGSDVLLQPLNMTTVGEDPAPTPEPKVDAVAARAVVEDVARRVLTKESKALTRAAKKYAGKPDEFRSWATTFYAAHVALVTRQFAPALRAAGIETTADAFAADHCAASLRAIATLVEQGTDAADVADEWTDIRPGEIADAIVARA